MEKHDCQPEHRTYAGNAGRLSLCAASLTINVMLENIMKNKPHSLVFAFGLLLYLPLCHGEPGLSPTLETKLGGTNSLVYCPTLEVAWDGLEDVVGGPIHMQQQDALVEKLNDAHCPAGVIPDEAHVALAGFTGQGFKAKLEEALRRKFGAEAPELPAIFSDEQTVIATYSYLNRILPFPKKFAPSKTQPLEFRSSEGTYPVQAFGAPKRSAEHFAAQVRILHYSNEDDFVIQLASRIKDEFIVLAKIAQPETLAAGVKTVKMHLDSKSKGSIELMVDGRKEFYLNTLSRGDLLAIPVVDLEVEADFPGLCNRMFKNDGFERIRLRLVYQNVQFKMDETGATVRSMAYGGGDSFGGPPSSSKPRRFIFDQPFLITLWKKDAKQPYLAVWVASPDVLIPFKTDKGKG